MDIFCEQYGELSFIYENDQHGDAIYTYYTINISEHHFHVT